MKLHACLLLVLVAGIAGFLAAGEAGGYKVIKTEKLGGEGSWDYLTLDTDAHRLYISRDTRVIVLDTETFKPLKEIPANGVHGVALVPELNKGFISNGKSNTVTIFDLKTMEKTGEAKTGQKPDAIMYEPFSKRIFTSDNGGTTATAIDPTTGQVAGKVELGGAAEAQVSDGKGHVYANIEDKDEVVCYDPVKLTVLSHWPLGPAKTPTGIAMDLEHRRLFSGCRGGKLLQVVDADSGKIVASCPIGAGVDAVTFDPGTQTVFSSNGDGTLTVIHEDSPDKYTVVQNVVTQPGAKTQALDLKKHQVWLDGGDRRKAAETFSILVVGKE